MRLHRDEVAAPLVRYWRLLQIRPAGEAGQRAQEAVANHLEALESKARRYEQRRARRHDAEPSVPSASP